jgi:hypothetical protein
MIVSSSSSYEEDIKDHDAVCSFVPSKHSVCGSSETIDLVKIDKRPSLAKP